MAAVLITKRYPPISLFSYFLISRGCKATLWQSGCLSYTRSVANRSLILFSRFCCMLKGELKRSFLYKRVVQNLTKACITKVYRYTFTMSMTFKLYNRCSYRKNLPLYVCIFVYVIRNHSTFHDYLFSVVYLLQPLSVCGHAKSRVVY